MLGMRPLRVEYCGEWYTVEAADGPFTIGRDSDLTIDENPYLHRTFLTLSSEYGLWWLSNVGQLLAATVSDATGSVQAWVAPGAKLPLVFQQVQVIFSAGATTYEFAIHAEEDFYNTSLTATVTDGGTTIMPVALTSTQRLLVLSLAERVLAQPAGGRATVPTSAEAAARLGWSMTTFNRKLDNVCEKLDRLGVDGLRGGRGKLATNRRMRLVEYAVATRLVSSDDLPLLDRATSDAEDTAGS
jgi:hypothetical protein